MAVVGCSMSLARKGQNVGQEVSWNFKDAFRGWVEVAGGGGIGETSRKEGI